MGVVADSASQRLAQEVTKKVRDTGLVLWGDADRSYSTGAAALLERALP